MSSHPCFWMEPTREVEISLRRYMSSSIAHRCEASGLGYHNASNAIERGARSSYPDVHGDRWPHHDPRWPKQCGCGYVFEDTDHWQMNPDELWRRVDTGELFTRDRAPAGALINADWLADWQHYRVGPDGFVLMVKLPDSTWWSPDGPAYPNNAPPRPGAWQRSGSVPLVTVTPSILIGGDGYPVSYHGFLTNGVLNSTPDSPC